MAEVYSLQNSAERMAEAAILLEQELLGGVLCYADAVGRVRHLLTPEHFCEPLHSRIWDTVCAVHDEHGATGHALVAAVVARLANEAPIGDLPVKAYIPRLIANQSGGMALNPAGIAAEMLNHHARRRLEEIGYRAIQSAQGLEEPTATARDLITDLDCILTSRQKTKPTDVSLAGAICNALAMDVERRDAGGVADVSLGLAGLDNMLGGLWPEDLVVLAGRPAMGKSNLAVALMLNVGLAGHGVAMYSQEMSTDQVGRRAAAALVSSRYSALRIPYDDLRRGQFTKAQQEAIEHAASEILEAPIQIDGAADLSMPDMMARTRRHRETFERRGQKLRLVIIDHLQIVAPPDRYRGSRVSEVSEITRAAKAMAKALNCTVLLLSQLSRKVEERPDKRPYLSDLRESGSIEQDADSVCFVYREEYYLAEKENKSIEEADRLEANRNVTEFIVAKQRSGAVGTVKLYTDMATGVVRDLETRW